MRKFLVDLFPADGVFGLSADMCAAVLMLIGAVLASLALERLARVFAKSFGAKISKKAKFGKGAAARRNVLGRASFIVFPICLLALVPEIFTGEEREGTLYLITKKCLYLYFYAAVWQFLIVALSAVNDVLSSRNRRSFKGFIQIVQVGVSAVFIVYAVSEVLGKSPTSVLAGIGASAAVMMFIFKDTLLGFAASVQLALNDTLRVGDWITMGKFGADGVVKEIGLNDVKILNWDNTVSTVPTFLFASEPFQNWRGIEIEGGRRVRRSINIDMHSVKFCGEGLLENLSSSEALAGFAKEAAKLFEPSAAENTITNLTVFRKYLEFYMDNSPYVKSGMIHFARLLEPTAKGVPVEMYFFTTIEWIEYENIQSRVCEHAIAALPLFGLRIYQDESDAASRG
ncbi:MAG: mechanosensitive ion channel [Opitutales bacterium]|nr:mechanosensitive ion channel [Opitutales bacterium]